MGFLDFNFYSLVCGCWDLLEDTNDNLTLIKGEKEIIKMIIIRRENKRIMIEIKKFPHQMLVNSWGGNELRDKMK